MVSVYLESNFVLELALGQEQAQYAAAILDRGEKGEVEIVLPALSISEPFSNLGYRGVERDRLFDLMKRQVNELARSVPHQQIVAQIETVLPVLIQVRRAEMEALEKVVDRLLGFARILNFDQYSFRQAVQYETLYGLSPQDAIIYSSVISDLARQSTQEEKCFISRNVKDFYDPRIKAELGSYNCRYIASFDDGFRYVNSRVQSS